MPIGKQDFSHIIEKPDVEQVGDYAELDVRLGSYYTHYRTGNFVWGTSFENSDASYQFGALSNATVEDYSGLTQHGSNAKKITVQETIGGQVNITRYEPFLTQKGIGFQYSVKAAADSGDHWLTMQIIKDGKNYPFSIRYFHDNTTWKVWDGSAYQTFLTQQMNDRSPDNYYDRVKLVVDAESKHYVACYINGTRIDLSAYELEGSTSTDTDVALFILSFTKVTGNDNIVYIDDLIITQNEPID